MPYIIIILFFIVAILALLEDKILHKQVVMVVFAFATIMILLSGFREVGIDYDSANYASAYRDYEIAEGVDISFLFISSFLHLFSDDAHAIFLFYALLGVSLKLFAIKRLSHSYLVPLMVYLCYYYEMHECMQIRSGILGGLYLLAIPYIAKGEKRIALMLLLLGSFFHISGLVLLPILFFGNKEFDKKSKAIWCLVIPFSYIVHFVGVYFLLSVNIPYIGDKLEIYQRLHESGHSELGINVFSPLLLMNVLMFYYLMYFSQTVNNENKYFPLMMKCYAIGISSYMFFSFLPVLSSRINILYDTVSIVLFSNVAYTVKPRWASVLALMVFCFLYLNYGLKCFEGFVFLWEV